MTNIELAPARSALAVSGDQSYWTTEQLAALRQIGVENAPQGDLAVFLNYAQRTGLDPFARQLYMIGRNSKDGKKWTIMASIDGLRIVAERSGDYAGQVGPEFCGEDGVWRDTWTAATPPVAARIGVLRQGFKEPLYAVAYYDEYVQKFSGKPSPMWEEKPRLMLAKCAEALALRKAFPNDLAGLYTSDEMGAVDNQRPAPTPVAEQVDVVTGEIVEDAPVDDTVTKAQLQAIGALFTKCGVEEREERLQVVGKVLGRPVGSSTEITKDEAHSVIDTLASFADGENPRAAINEWAGWYVQ